MTKIGIITDSSAYLPQEALDQYSIRVVPQVVLWGEDAFLEGVEIDIQEFYRRLRQDPNHPKTTQPNPEDFRRVYEEMAKDHDGIVAVVISSKLSGTVGSAEAAAKDFYLPTRVVDSQGTSMALGFAVLAAARAASAGAGIDEVEQAALSAVKNTRLIFVVDTLEYLHRGGRIGGASKLLGTALSIKPLLHLEDGRVEPLERVRTKTKAIERMLDLIAEYADGQPVRAAVIHANALQDAQALVPRVEERLSCMEMFVTELSPAIATHAGPGTLAVAVCKQA